MKRTNQPDPANGFSVAVHQPVPITAKEFIHSVQPFAETLLNKYALRKFIDHRTAASGLNELARILVPLSSRLLELATVHLQPKPANTISPLRKFCVCANQPIDPQVQKMIDSVKSRSEVFMNQYTKDKPIDPQTAATELAEIVRVVIPLTERLLDLAMEHAKRMQS